MVPENVLSIPRDKALLYKRSPMVKVGIVGATGYTGIELLKILLQHPQVQVTLLTSEKYAGKKIEDVFCFFQGQTDLVLEELSAETVDKKCDLVFCCLPHQSAMTPIPEWIKRGKKVIDLSADFRFESAAVYEKWYGKHTAPDLLKKAVYGLSELYREKIKKASLIGNPGCYPTGALLSLVPLLQKKIIDPKTILIDSKSGVTGAGRSAVLESLYSEVNESVHAYKVGKHRHMPEIEKELSIAAGEDVVISFTPHLIPMDRGILSTIYARPLKPTDTKSILTLLSDFYKDEDFVRILPEGILPKTKDVRGTNNCFIGAVYDPRTKRLVLIAAIDNLMKGASSQAVQNMNLMCGFEETTALK